MYDSVGCQNLNSLIQFHYTLRVKIANFAGKVYGVLIYSYSMTGKVEKRIVVLLSSNHRHLSTM